MEEDGPDTPPLPGPAPPPAPKRYPGSCWNLTRKANGRIPTTSDKFNLGDHALTILEGSGREYVRFIFVCKFVCNDDTGFPTDFAPGWDAAKGFYRDALNEVRRPKGHVGDPKPVIGLMRFVWPSPTNPAEEINHIIPYLINDIGKGAAKQTVWFLEQYDTTFWWLFNERVRIWDQVVGEAMIGVGTFIRAYVPAAAALSETQRYTSGPKMGLTGYTMDLQKTGEGKDAVSKETCIPWSMVILKYIMNPKSVGIRGDPVALETMGYEYFETMYKDLYTRRENALTWVEGKVWTGKGRKTHRRRRQTRRKTKRSRK